jgi:NAD(P)-dependent dehydrogenase (short-subunit alcohol dehydrogenase family)
MNRLQNKTAVITGGNSGIGLATAKEFIKEGARVIITGRDAATLEAAAKDLGPQAQAIQADITDPDGLTKVFETAASSFGKVDILFANAGVAGFAPFEGTDERLFDHNMDVNVKGTYFTIQKAVPYLSEGASVIINTSIVNTKGFAGTSAYSASKAALRSLTRTLAGELVTKNIRVNAVSPGPINTPIYGRLGMPEDAVQEMASGFQALNPMKRFGNAEEVAKPVVFFASDDASYVTGAELAIDGGMSYM